MGLHRRERALNRALRICWSTAFTTSAEAERQAEADEQEADASGFGNDVEHEVIAPVLDAEISGGECIELAEDIGAERADDGAGAIEQHDTVSLEEEARIREDEIVPFEHAGADVKGAASDGHLVATAGNTEIEQQ